MGMASGHLLKHKSEWAVKSIILYLLVLENETYDRLNDIMVTSHSK